MKSAMASEMLTRDIIRRRLSGSRTRKARGDNVTAQGLVGAPDVTPVDLTKYDPAKWGGLVSTRAVPHAGAARIAAAVLVPLIERDDGYAVLLTQRTPDLSAHGGQIAFPGGRAEPSDADANATALRETWEEIGLGPSHIDILGHLDPYLTVSGFEVTPVVAAVTLPFDLAVDPMEVAEVFEMPLAFLLNRGNHQRHSRRLADGVTRAYHAIPFGERYIWGATAGMLLNLYEVLTAS
jgi:8-oxo-dGTP pyrophosphatase MutT (NUDIX family)